MLHQFRGWSLGRSEGSLLPSPLPHPSEAVGEEKIGGREGGSQEKEVSFLLSSSSDFTDLTRRKRKREEGGFPKKKLGLRKKGEFLLYGIQAGKKMGRWISGGKCLASFFGQILTQDFLYPSQKQKQQHFLCRKFTYLTNKITLFYYGRLLRQIKRFLLPKIARPFNRSCPL